jgi:hypothetical protein
MSDAPIDTPNDPAPAPADEPTLVTGADDAPKADDQPKADGAPKADGQPKANDDAPKADDDAPKGDDDAPKGDDEPKVEGAPEEYAEFTLPEGIELDTEITDQFKGVAKELNLTQEQAQRVVELGAQMRQRDAEAIIATRQEWLDQSKSDTEFGGDKLDASLGVAKRAISAFGNDAFVQLLNQTGLGNHPEFIRFAMKAGKAVAEDEVITSGNKQSTPHGSLAKRLYGTDKE